MNGSRRSIPFHVTLLTLMVLIVLPLAAALLWLGWRSVDQLEDRSIRHRMAALDSAVEGFLTSGLRLPKRRPSRPAAPSPTRSGCASSL